MPTMAWAQASSARLPWGNVMGMRVLGLAAAALACGLVFATSPAMAADYAPPPVYTPPPQPVYVPAPQSCCCPTVRRGLYLNFSSCGYRSAQYGAYPNYGSYPQYPVQQPYAAPAYYQPQPYPVQPYQGYPQQYSSYGPAYAPQAGVGVGVGPVGVGVTARVAYRGSRQHCWKSHGRWICR